MQELEQENIIIELSTALIGGGMSYDFLVTKQSPFLEIFDGGLFALCDSRVFKRIILSGFTKKEATKFIEQNDLDITKVKLLNRFQKSMDLVLIDHDVVYMFKHGDRVAHKVKEDEEAELLEEFNLHFDYLWDNSETLLLYENFDGLYLPEKQEKIIIATTDFYEKLILALKTNPNIIHQVDSADFEELVARLLQKKGYDVQVTPKIKDGGKDILARFTTPTGDNLLCLVECKKYSIDRPIGVGLIRALYGVVQSERANLGMLVTTSNFTRGSKEFQKLHNSQISLKDFQDLKNWLHSYG